MALSARDVSMSQPSQSSAAVIMFPPSLDCALARFLLAYYGVTYEERRHTILFTFIPTLWHGHTMYFPLLFGGGYPPLNSVQAMIDYFDPRCPGGRNLRLDGEDAAQVAKDWESFHQTLGTAVTAFAYFHLLPLRSVMIPVLTEGAPAFEVWTVRVAYPLFAAFIRRGLKLSESGARQALGEVRAIVKSVEERLADGRRFLVGGRFSLSDMSLANALAPLVLAPQYGGPLPTFDQMPPELQAVAREMQASPAGQFALRMYRDHMRPPA
jgi:glutathione S-transferase